MVLSSFVSAVQAVFFYGQLELKMKTELAFDASVTKRQRDVTETCISSSTVEIAYNLVLALY
jgi:hypothetical protein